MTSTAIGLNLKYLPWQLVVPIMFGLSILCIYGAVTERGKTKVLNIVLFCLAIMGFISGIETLANNTGIFIDYLPFLNPIMYSVFGITMFLVLWN